MKYARAILADLLLGFAALCEATAPDSDACNDPMEDQ